MSDLFTVPATSAPSRRAAACRKALGGDFHVDVIRRPGNTPVVAVAYRYHLETHEEREITDLAIGKLEKAGI